MFEVLKLFVIMWSVSVMCPKIYLGKGKHALLAKQMSSGCQVSPSSHKEDSSCEVDSGLLRALEHDTALVCALSRGFAFNLQASA